ncbi:hypothetical protein AYJ08_05905 [Brevibacillus sp. SKDU10]|nr:hypothetical protein [Brevibacillus sp. SKDU10]OAJ75191.1 hypothetical protein AYJ08_05905 [Brevibacillus sp. SKDU10]
MRSGKDTVAAYLVEHYDFIQYAFGDGIKRICRELFPEQFVDDKKPRALLQGVGQAMRAIDPDVWIKRTMREVYTAQGFDVVITDLRQPNEYARLYAEGYVIIRVNTSDDVRIDRMRSAGDVFDLADFTHDTERYVDMFAVHYELNNNGSVLDLWEQIECVMRDIMHKEAV